MNKKLKLQTAANEILNKPINTEKVSESTETVGSIVPDDKKLKAVYKCAYLLINGYHDVIYTESVHANYILDTLYGLLNEDQ